MNRIDVLKKLAKENNILRMGNAEGNLTVEDAIRFIRKYERVIKESEFPESMYGLLG